MKIICAILGLLGLGWAWFALGNYALLITVIFDDSWDTGVGYVIYAGLGCLLATLGYWVWSGWILRIFKGRYHWVDPRSFWMICLFPHAGWFLFLTVCDVVNGGSWVESDIGPLFLWWNVSLTAISVAGMVKEWNEPRPKRSRLVHSDLDDSTTIDTHVDR